MQRALALALALACAVPVATGCRSLRPIPRAAPMPAAPDRVEGAEDLVVFVAENTAAPLTEEELARPGTDKARRLAAVDEQRLARYARDLRASLATALDHAGLGSTVDPWSGAEVVATATSEVRPELEWETGGVSISTRTTLVLSDPRGKPLATVEVSVPASDEDELDTAEALDRRLRTHARRAAVEAVRALRKAPELATYLEGRRTRKSISELMKEEEEREAAAGAAVERRTSTDLHSAREAAAAFVAGASRPTSYGLAIGVERYAGGKGGSVGARSDATRFAGLLLRTLGVPEENLRLAVDEGARREDLEREIAWLAGSAKPHGRLYLFFGGTASADPRSGRASLLAHDGKGAGVGLEATLRRLGESGADVLAVVDACPPRKARRRGRARPPKLPARVVLVTTPEGGCAQGELSLYLTEGLGTAQADADGNHTITLEELRDFVGKRMAQGARFETGKGTAGLSFHVVEGLENKE